MFAGERIIPKIINGRMHYTIISPDAILADVTRSELARIGARPQQEALSEMLLRNKLSDPVQRLINY
jgi:hypothetical protein